MNMTATSKRVTRYARSISKKLNDDDYSLWFDFTHVDGTEVQLTSCLYESVLEDPNDPDSDPWIIIWTKNHGMLMYNENELTTWQSGYMDDRNIYSGNLLILPV